MTVIRAAEELPDFSTWTRCVRPWSSESAEISLVGVLPRRSRSPDSCRDPGAVGPGGHGLSHQGETVSARWGADGLEAGTDGGDLRR